MKCTVNVNWIDEKTVKIPDFLAQKTKKPLKLTRNTGRQGLSPLELLRLERLINNRESPTLNPPGSKENFRLVSQLQTLFVSLFSLIKV